MEKIILIIVSSLLLLAGKSRAEISDLEEKSFDYKICNYMDSSVNDMELWYDCLYKIPDSILASHKIYNPEYDFGYFEANETKDEFLYLGLQLGGTGKELGYLVVTDTIPPYLMEKTINRNRPKFITSNGAYIGMSIKEFKTKYPNTQYKGIGYTIGDINDGSAIWVPFEKYYQFEQYRMIYNRFCFKDGKLVRIEIAFDI